MHTHYGLDSREEESQATGKDCRPSIPPPFPLQHLQCEDLSDCSSWCEHRV